MAVDYKKIGLVNTKEMFARSTSTLTLVLPSLLVFVRHLLCIQSTSTHVSTAVRLVSTWLTSIATRSRMFFILTTSWLTSTNRRRSLRHKKSGSPKGFPLFFFVPKRLE